MDNEQTGFKLSNGSDPAMPVVGIRESEKSMKLYGQMFHGLTKREHFAAMAMQGLIAGFNSCIEPHNWSCSDIADHAVDHADALLKALDEN